MYNITVQGYHDDPGGSSQSPYERASAELRELYDENAKMQLFGLAIGAASFAWWIWGMVLSQRQCERHNLAVYAKARAITREGDKG